MGHQEPCAEPAGRFDSIELLARTAGQQRLEFRNAEYPSVVGNNQIFVVLAKLDLDEVLPLPRAEIVGVLEELEGPANPGGLLALQSQNNSLENAPGIVSMCLFPVDFMSLSQCVLAHLMFLTISSVNSRLRASWPAIKRIGV